MKEVELKPFLKWPGGKTKELKVIIPNLPAKMNNYYEPFVGGGAVYFAIANAKHYFINDKSKNLVNLYQNIKSKNNKKLFNILFEINIYWKKLDEIFNYHKSTLVNIFFALRNSEDYDIKTAIKQFINNNISNFIDPIQIIFGFDLKFYSEELKINLNRKMKRMKELEKEKGLLPDVDVSVNILTAIKSSFYMYLRMLYNNPKKYNISPMVFSAIYYFIRNYTYSGMFRYNVEGKFNVPYGGIGYNGNSLDKKIKYISSRKIQIRLKSTIIENKDFYDFMKSRNMTKNDFIFLDPPYDTEFSTYDQNEFTQNDQKRLANYLITKTICKWMLVIKNTDFVHKLYKRRNINIKYFDKSYNVSFMNRNDKKAEHLLITNY